MDDGFEVNFFGRDQRKALLQVKPHLVAKHAFGACAGAVGLEHAMRIDVAHKVFVRGGVLHFNVIPKVYRWHPSRQQRAW